MEQTKKALAVKKLQTELKEEKEAERRRYVFYHMLPYMLDTPLQEARNHDGAQESCGRKETIGRRKGQGV